MRKFTLIPAALILAGCSQSPAQEPVVVEDTFTPPPAPSYSTDQPFQFVTDEGAEGVIQFGADPFPGFLEYQAAVGNTDTFSFATVDVDNRQGQSAVDSIAATAYTEAGEQHECAHVNNAMGTIPEEPTTPEALDLYYEIDGTYTVNVGQRETVHLVCAGETPDTVSSAAFRTMGTEYPAWPAQEEGN